MSYGPDGTVAGPGRAGHGSIDARSRRCVRGHGRDVGHRARGLRACVSEAVSNAVVHAFRDGRPAGTITVSAEQRAGRPEGLRNSDATAARAHRRPRHPLGGRVDAMASSMAPSPPGPRAARPRGRDRRAPRPRSEHAAWPRCARSRPPAPSGCRPRSGRCGRSGRLDHQLARRRRELRHRHEARIDGGYLAR